MFLRTNVTTRRKFLERSALGAGSLLIAPLLLNSCADHVIPDPNPKHPAIPPYDPSTAYEIDPNDAAKTSVTTALDFIPEVGGILSGLVDILWPDSTNDVWDDIKDKVEALVNQQIAAADYQRVTDALGSLNDGPPSGLIGVMSLYLQELGDYNKSVTKHQEDPTQPVPDATNLRTQWSSTKNLFVDKQADFQQKGSGNEFMLLPLFVQFANMYLTVLRDVVIDANNNPDPATSLFNRSSDERLQDQQALSSAISGYIKWTDDTYNAAFAKLAQNTPNDTTPTYFYTLNNFNRQVIQTVFDFMDAWPYYDVTQYPNGAKNQDGTPINTMPREIYSDPFGSGPITPPYPVPTQFPTQLTVWAYDRIDAVQLTYPAGSGPGGVTTTPRMGDQSGGTSQYPHDGQPGGGMWNLTPDNPFTKARALYATYNDPYTIGPFVNGLQFELSNGIPTNVCGYHNLNSVVKQYDTGLFGYTNRALSSVYINGVGANIGSAAAVVFGFRNWQAPAVQLNAIRAHYVKSPKEKSVADYAKAYPKLAMPADLITDELKEIRKKYWVWVKARAKK